MACRRRPSACMHSRAQPSAEVLPLQRNEGATMFCSYFSSMLPCPSHAHSHRIRGLQLVAPGNVIWKVLTVFFSVSELFCELGMHRHGAEGSNRWKASCWTVLKLGNSASNCIARHRSLGLLSRGWRLQTASARAVKGRRLASSSLRCMAL